MNALVGTIGDADVSDCANLTKEALKKYPQIVDPKRVGTFGGSHGGFLTGWLIGHSEFRSLYKAGCLWNPVVNMSFMTQSTDIPDWITACCEGKEFEYGYSAEANDLYFKKSPFSVVGNVECPTLLVVGTKDFRVPPQQSYLYYNTLRSRFIHLFFFFLFFFWIFFSIFQNPTEVSQQSFWCTQKLDMLWLSVNLEQMQF